jgi:hypothetical protein
MKTKEEIKSGIELLKNKLFESTPNISNEIIDAIHLAEAEVKQLTQTLEMVEDVLQRCDAIYPNSTAIRNEIRVALGRDILEEQIMKAPADEVKERQQVFFKNANKEKRNFELHQTLIIKHLCDRENTQYSDDLKNFAERQVVDGNLLISLMEYAEEYGEVKYGTKSLSEIFGLGDKDLNNDITYPRS